MHHPSLDAVIFDWGGTLTRWHDIDFHAESLALAHAVAATSATDGRDSAVEPLEAHAARLHEAGAEIWRRSRDHQQSARISDLFDEAGLAHDPELLTAYYEFWEPHTQTDPDVRPLWESLRADGIRIGVLSNTIWPRAWHRHFFARDGVLDLIDGDVYTSEVPWTKPSSRAFEAAMEAVGAAEPSRCVYVGDRLYDDVWGAQQAGMRAVHVPHSTIPDAQRGHTEGDPDAVVERLSDLLGVVHDWS